MTKCINIVDGSCSQCDSKPVKYGKTQNKQRYYCKHCKKTWLTSYTKQAYLLCINANVAAHVKEGCGIRSIARLLKISSNTVLKRIKMIAESIQKPPISIGKDYEADELRTYVKKKTNDYWVIYAIDKESRQVADFKVGKRTKTNIQNLMSTLLLSACKKIYTDGLNNYRIAIPKEIHRVKRYGTNKIERKNLNLRTHLKRLNRKTICFSKSIAMLEACLKIYFWYGLYNLTNTRLIHKKLLPSG